MSTSVLFAQLLFLTALPTHYHGASWGMSIAELKNQNTVHKASQHGQYNYADHSEKNPDVYLRTTPKNKRIEYYFFKKKLYKIYVIHPKSTASTKKYQQLLRNFKQQYGSKTDNYQETYFGLKIQHNKWQDNDTSLDLRFGAGFIYEVWVEKRAEKEKARSLERGKSI